MRRWPGDDAPQQHHDERDGTPAHRATPSIARRARSAAPKAAKAFFVDRDVHPQTLAVLRTRAEPLGWDAPELVALELYLMERARGMTMEGVGVRP